MIQKLGAKKLILILCVLAAVAAPLVGGGGLLFYIPVIVGIVLLCGWFPIGFVRLIKRLPSVGRGRAEGIRIMKFYLLLIVPWSLFVWLALREDVLEVLLWVTFGLGVLIVLALANLLVIALGLFPAVALSSTRFASVGWVVSLLLIPGFFFGPGLIRDRVQDVAFDDPALVEPVPLADVRSVEIVWREGALTKEARNLSHPCGDLCLALLRGGGVDWVRFVHPSFGAVQIYAADGADRRIRLSKSNGERADLLVNDVASFKSRDDMKRFRIWHGLINFGERTAIDQRNQQTVLARLSALYRGVADFTYITAGGLMKVADITYIAGNRDMKMPDWALADTHFGKEYYDTSLVSDLQSLGLTLAPAMAEPERNQILSDIDGDYILLALERKQGDAIDLQSSDRFDRSVYRRFLSRFDDKNFPISAEDGEVLAQMYLKAQYRSKDIMEFLDRAGRLDVVAEQISLSEVKSALNTSAPQKKRVMSNLAKLSPAAQRRVWELFEARYGIFETYREATFGGQAFLLGKINSIADDPRPYIEIALAIPLAEVGWTQHRKAGGKVVEEAFSAARRAKPDFHAELSTQILAWLKAHENEIKTSSCDRLLQSAFDALWRMKAGLELEEFVQRGSFECIVGS